MQVYQGKSASGGIAIGRLYVFQSTDVEVKCYKVDDTQAEIIRFQRARDQAMKQLDDLYEKAARESGEESAAIFQVHQMLLMDEEYLKSIFNMISTQKVNAEYAVAAARDNYYAMFSSMDDEYMRARAVDIRDISGRVLAILNGRAGKRLGAEGMPDAAEGVSGAEDTRSEKAPVIILAEDLTPSETVQLDKEQVLAFVTVRGSANSHTAILARTYGIPAIVGLDVSCAPKDGQQPVLGSEAGNQPVLGAETGEQPVSGAEAGNQPASKPENRQQPAAVGLDSLLHGHLAVADGDTGYLYVDPDEETLQLMKQKQEAVSIKKQLLADLKGKESISPDGRKIAFYANIGNSADLPLVIENDAEGIGLFRSEFLYLEKETFPTEEEQFEVYKNVAQTMAGKQVIIRTLDIGADKQASYMQLAGEENPAMGLRAIRICLNRPQILKTQLRAIYRAGSYGNVAVMYPMITSVKEVKQIKALAEEVKAELSSEGVEYKDIAQGIMIETPAAAMISDLLAKEVDFFSIGTNDLTQYTLAVDRQNEALEPFYDPYHPAVLRLIKQTVENAHRAGIRCGICGELGADTGLTGLFLSLGVDSLSMSPGSILAVRKAVRETEGEETDAIFRWIGKSDI